jgi:exodeoxyribonuclease-3
LLAVWAMNHRVSAFHPQVPERQQVQQALVVYEAFLRKGFAVVAGDFNNATIWDRKRPHPANFASTLQALQERHLVSAYHATRGIPPGSEPDATIYWRDRTLDGPKYHIDYCFVQATWIAGLRVEVGSHADWVARKLSDHVPLVVDVSPLASDRPISG